MQKLDFKIYNDLLRRWKAWPAVIRKQVVAKHIFDINVDFSVGKITQNKPSGGRRLIEVPNDYDVKNAADMIIDRMSELGWEFEITKLPRSNVDRCIVNASHATKGLFIEVDDMPRPDGIAFASICARIAAGEKESPKPLLISKSQVKANKWKSDVSAFKDPIPEDYKLV